MQTTNRCGTNRWTIRYGAWLKRWIKLFLNRFTDGLYQLMQQQSWQWMFQYECTCPPSLSLHLAPSPPFHLSAPFLLPPGRKIDMYSAWRVNISICEKHFLGPHTLGWRTQPPTQVCALLAELFHFRLSNNAATTSLHVPDICKEKRWSCFFNTVNMYFLKPV